MKPNESKLPVAAFALLDGYTPKTGELRYRIARSSVTPTEHALFEVGEGCIAHGTVSELKAKVKPDVRWVTAGERL